MKVDVADGKVVSSGLEMSLGAKFDRIKSICYFSWTASCVIKAASIETRAA